MSEPSEMIVTHDEAAAARVLGLELYRMNPEMVRTLRALAHGLIWNHDLEQRITTLANEAAAEVAVDSLLGKIEQGID